MSVDLAIGHYNLKGRKRRDSSAEQKNLYCKWATAPAWISSCIGPRRQKTVTVEANAVRVQADSGEVSTSSTNSR